jgi:hypothetical protein
LHAGAGLCHPAIQERSSKPLRSCCMPHHPAANSLEWLSVSPSGRMGSVVNRWIHIYISTDPRRHLTVDRARSYIYWSAPP